MFLILQLTLLLLLYKVYPIKLRTLAGLDFAAGAHCLKAVWSLVAWASRARTVLISDHLIIEIKYAQSRNHQVEMVGSNCFPKTIWVFSTGLQSSRSGPKKIHTNDQSSIVLTMIVSIVV